MKITDLSKGIYARTYIMKQICKTKDHNKFLRFLQENDMDYPFFLREQIPDIKTKWDNFVYHTDSIVLEGQKIVKEVFKKSYYPKGVKENYQLKQLLEDRKSRKIIKNYFAKNYFLRYNIEDIKKLCEKNKRS